MRRLICAFVDQIWHKTCFRMTWPNYTNKWNLSEIYASYFTLLWISVTSNPILFIYFTLLLQYYFLSLKFCSQSDVFRLMLYEEKTSDSRNKLLFLDTYHNYITPLMSVTLGASTGIWCFILDHRKAWKMAKTWNIHGDHVAWKMAKTWNIHGAWSPWIYHAPWTFHVLAIFQAFWWSRMKRLFPLEPAAMVPLRV